MKILSILLIFIINAYANDLKIMKDLKTLILSDLQNSGVADEEDFKYAKFKDYNLKSNPNHDYIINVSFKNIKNYTNFGKKIILKDVAVSFFYILAENKINCNPEKLTTLNEKGQCYKKIKSYIAKKNFIFKTDDILIKGNSLQDFFIDAEDMNHIKYLKSTKEKKYFLKN